MCWGSANRAVKAIKVVRTLKASTSRHCKQPRQCTSIFFNVGRAESFGKVRSVDGMVSVDNGVRFILLFVHQQGNS